MNRAGENVRTRQPVGKGTFDGCPHEADILFDDLQTCILKF